MMLGGVYENDFRKYFISLFGPAGVFRSFQRWLSVLPGAHCAQALSVRTPLKRNGHRPRANTHVRVNVAFFSMQHCSLTTSNPANYGSIQVVREGYCDSHVMLFMEKLIKNCESTSQILTGWSQNNGNHPGTAVVFLNLLIGNMGKVVRAGCQNYEWKVS